MAFQALAGIMAAASKLRGRLSNVKLTQVEVAQADVHAPGNGSNVVSQPIQKTGRPD